MMLDSAATQNQIAQLLARHFNLEVLSPETDLIETGALDSLSFVELLVHLEREFGVKVTLAELEIDNFRSIAKVAEFVASRRQPV